MCSIRVFHDTMSMLFTMHVYSYYQEQAGEGQLSLCSIVRYRAVLVML